MFCNINFDIYQYWEKCVLSLQTYHKNMYLRDNSKIFNWLLAKFMKRKIVKLYQNSI